MANEQANQFVAQATQSIQSGQFAQALELLNQAITLDPMNAEAYILRGIALAQTGQPDAATESFQTAIRNDPASAKAYFNLSVHYYGIGQKQMALEAAQSALAVDPNHVGARDMVGRIQSELGYSAPQPQPQVPQPQPAAPQDPMAPQAPPTTTEAPMGTPYGAAPAGQPAPYYRSPYEQMPDQPVHSIAFVGNMGPTWNIIGWSIVGLAAVIFVISIINSGSMIMEMFSNPEKMRAQSENPFASLTPGNIILQIASYATLFASMVWTIMDIADRRGNWVWMVPYVLCCCCGMHWAVQGIYMAAGRNK